LVPQSYLDKMRAAGPVRRDYSVLSSPQMEEIVRLMRMSTSASVQIQIADMALQLFR
jgi:oxaloacetate decarboxylase alpha subunit